MNFLKGMNDDFYEYMQGFADGEDVGEDIASVKASERQGETGAPSFEVEPRSRRAMRTPDERREIGTAVGSGLSSLIMGFGDAFNALHNDNAQFDMGKYDNMRQQWKDVGALREIDANDLQGEEDERVSAATAANPHYQNLRNLAQQRLDNAARSQARDDKMQMHSENLEAMQGAREAGERQAEEDKINDLTLRVANAQLHGLTLEQAIDRMVPANMREIILEKMKVAGAGAGLSQREKDEQELRDLQLEQQRNAARSRTGLRTPEAVRANVARYFGQNMFSLGGIPENNRMAESEKVFDYMINNNSEFRELANRMRNIEEMNNRPDERNAIIRRMRSLVVESELYDQNRAKFNI
ncbi:MAG: hypothetical protein FWE23_08900 [Chitinivibrionia bacterium]|nr:hypothetical protein [Chitinivibrionia bacterium]